MLYHYEDMPGESSIELDLDQIKRVCKDIGFEFEVTEKENFIFEKKRRWYLKNNDRRRK